MRRDGGDGNDGYASLMDTLTEALLSEAEMPPREVQGCSQEFLDGDVVPDQSICQGLSLMKGFGFVCMYRLGQGF